MKLFKAILFYVIVALSFIVSIVFAFLQVRTIIAGDFNLMENPGMSFVGYFFRFIVFDLMFVTTLYVLVKYLKNKPMDIYSLILNATTIGASAVTFNYYDWFVTLVILLVNTCVLLSQVFLLKRDLREPQEA